MPISADELQRRLDAFYGDEPQAVSKQMLSISGGQDYDNDQVMQELDCVFDEPLQPNPGRDQAAAAESVEPVVAVEQVERIETVKRPPAAWRWPLAESQVREALAREKQRKRDDDARRRQARNDYAAQKAAEGKQVRAYTDLSKMTDEERTAHERAQRRRYRTSVKPKISEAELRELVAILDDLGPTDGLRTRGRLVGSKPPADSEAAREARRQRAEAEGREFRPRTNLAAMTGEEAKEHRRRQWREQGARRSARKVAEETTTHPL